MHELSVIELALVKLAVIESVDTAVRGGRGARERRDLLPVSAITGAHRAGIGRACGATRA